MVMFAKRNKITWFRIMVQFSKKFDKIAIYLKQNLEYKGKEKKNKMKTYLPQKIWNF